MQEKETQDKSIKTVNEENSSENKTGSILVEDPEDWIRNHIIGNKNMMIKAQYMSRLGVKLNESMSQDNKEKLNNIYEEERKKIEEEERELGNDKLMVEKTYSNSEFSINFLIKSDDEMRSGYISKLINMKIMKTAPTKKHQTSKL